MTNEFIDIMAKRSDTELLEILSKYRNDYQPDAIIAAENECAKRNLTCDYVEIAKYQSQETAKNMKIKIKKTKISNKRLSFYITLAYVGLGTIFSLMYWTYSNPMLINETFGQILFCFFLPTSFISIGIIFTVRDAAFFILITQTITFLLIWAFIYAIIKAFRKEQKHSDNVTTP